MFRKHRRRSINIVFVVFRLMLSLAIFAVLLAGIYSAYKHFSGLDPLKVNPQAVFSNLLSFKNLGFLSTISSNQLAQKVSEQSSQAPSPIPLDKLIRPDKTAKKVLNFLLVADSHSDNANLKKALAQAKANNPQFVVGLGDYTDVGTANELRKAKQEFDSTGLRYFLAVGDHDLWDCRNRSLPPDCNFKEVFGPTYQSFNYDQFKFITLYNSDNYLGLGEEQLKWLTDELQNAKMLKFKGIYVFVHEPLFHPSSEHMMGRVEKNLKNQAHSLIATLKEAGVKKIFAGDTHYFSEYSEPETNLPMVTVGAITADRNPQAPRFAVVSLYDDGSTEVEDVEIRTQ